MAIILRNTNDDQENKTTNHSEGDRPYSSPLKTAADVIEFARNNGIETSPLDISEVINKIGIKVFSDDLGLDISGFIEKRNSQWVIGINKYQIYQRQRFTLAHELGHYVLHQSQIESGRITDQNLFRDDTNNPIEKEANNFAGDLLMPAEEFRTQIIQKQVRDFSVLAETFGVTIAAARYRAYQLGFIDRY